MPTSRVPASFQQMLAELASQKSSGVLQVKGSRGWKVIELQAGSIRVITDSNRRLRLGELLVARGKVQPEALRRALEIQKTSGKPLGEVLVQRGLVSMADVQELVRFQVEEELYDLFTWEDAECSFQPGATIGDQIEDYPGSVELQIDPQRVLQEASRRIQQWRQLEKVILSEYMSFRLTERGRSMLATASRGARKLLELVQDGLCVSSIVRLTMVGRFTVWKSLVDLLEAQAIAVIPDAELATLAQRWEAEGKLESAWGALMRLSELASDPHRAAELQDRAQALRQRLDELEAKAMELPPPSAPAARAGHSRALVLVGVLVVLVFAAVLVPGVGILGSRKEDLGPYREAARRAQELAARGEIAAARDVWEEFLAVHPKGMAAELAKSAKEILDEQYEQLVELEIDRARRLEQEKNYGGAIELYDEILKKFPRTTKQARIVDLRNRARRERDDYVQKLTREQLRQTFERGKQLFDEKRYGDAREAFQNVLGSELAGAELRAAAKKELAKVEEVERRAEAMIKAAQAKEEELQLEEALRIYQECHELWGESSWGRVAAEKITVLGRDRLRANRLYEEGLRSYSSGEFAAAVSRLREAARFKGFQAAEQAAKKLEDIQAAGKRSTELLERARRLQAEGRAEEAFEVLAELAERFPHTQAARDLKLDIRIESVPQGATVSRDGRELGVTPLTLRLGAYESAALIFSKSGFQSVTEKLERPRKPVLRVRLKKELAFRRGLPRSASAGPVVAQERFLVRAGGLLVAFSPGGAPLWQLELGEPPSEAAAGLAAEGDFAFAATSRPSLLVMDSATGRLRRELGLQARPVTSPVAKSFPLLAGRTFVLICCEDGRSLFFDALEGSQRWDVKIQGPVRFDPVLTERAVAIASAGGTLEAFDVLTGRPLWQRKVVGEIASGPAADPAGGVFAFITTLGEFYALDARDGALLAKVVLEGCRGGGVALGDGVAFVAGHDGLLRAVDAATGAVLWMARLDGQARYAPLAAGSAICVGTGRGSLFCLDAKSGREEWVVDAGSAVVGSPALCGGKIAVCTSDGEFLGVELGR